MREVLAMKVGRSESEVAAFLASLKAIFTLLGRS